MTCWTGSDCDEIGRKGPPMKLKVSRGLATGLVCLALVALGACGRNDPAKLVSSAKEYLAKRDYTPAVIQLKNALQKEPTNGEARYLLGVALNEAGDPVSAEKELRRALEYKYPPAAVLPALAGTMLRLGQADKLVEEFGTTTLDYPGAMKIVDEVLAKSPDEPEALALKADLLLAQNQIEPAKETLAQLIKAQPNNGGARFALVTVLIDEKRFEQA